MAEKRVTDHLDELVARGVVPGIQYAVVDANSILLKYSGGVEDVAASQEKVTDSTTFLSCSTTKVLTAAAVLKLVDANKVGLNDPLSKFFAEHPYGEDVTVCHLLNQSSGIPNPMPLSWFHTIEEHPEFSESQALNEILGANPKLVSEPGKKYSYSNLSYWLLGKIIERASGMSYSEYMRNEIFEPLGISPRELDYEIQDEQNYARGHQPRFSFMTLLFWMLTLNKCFWDYSSGKWARYQVLYMNGPSYGGIVGTATGFATFLQDFLRPQSKLLSDETKALFFQEQRDADGNVMPTTLGWHRGKVGQHVYYGKPGGGPGYNSNIRIYPEAGIATVYLCNKTEVNEGPINAFADTLDREFLSERD